MIQFLPVIALGYFGAAAIGALKKSTSHKTKQVQKNKKTGPALKTEAIRIVRETIIEDDNIILSKEDMPLDNRFGKKPLVSENRFSRTANITMELERNRDLSGTLGADIFSLLEAKAQTKMASTLGFKIGSNITREIKLKFIAAAGQFAHYRVVWKQDTRRGVYDVEMAGKQYTIPFMVTYGLCHSVESINEKDDKNGIQ
ncbi:MAG: hypothetical protein HQL69_21365 [Magnetococcales bacterium]|nr:hypothetical protein [Magnetococcales bacterium]